GLNEDRLYVSDTRADGGPVLKRFLTRSMGRADKILKRTTHLTVEVREGVKAWTGKKPEDAKAKNKKPLALPKKTDAGTAIRWVSLTPKICKVKAGKLVLTGKKGVCRVSAVAGGTGSALAFKQQYSIRVK
ncbi:MAG: uL22 family ribosomal protein, partial [Actinomycetes bacterium]